RYPSEASGEHGTPARMRSSTLPRMSVRCNAIAPVVCLAVMGSAAALGQVITDRAHHLRSGEQREWDDFPERAEGREWVVRFAGSKNAAERTLRLRQRDVKQAWRVRVNGRGLGTLIQDEAQIVNYLPVPAEALHDGENELRVSCEGGQGGPSDDVALGEMELIDRPRAEALGEASLSVEVVDGDGGKPL